MASAQSSVTDVRPTRNGLVLATCECGLECTFSNESDAWDWILAHDCRQPGRTGPPKQR